MKYVSLGFAAACLAAALAIIVVAPAHAGQVSVTDPSNLFSHAS